MAMDTMRIMRTMRAPVEMHGAHVRASGRDAEKPVPPSEAVGPVATE
jgi:hypothetical protein